VLLLQLRLLLLVLLVLLLLLLLLQLRHRTLLHRTLLHRKLLLDGRCGQREQGEVWHCRLLGTHSRLHVALRHSDGRARQGG
jgi:hypothetical protein